MPEPVQPDHAPPDSLPAPSGALNLTIAALAVALDATCLSVAAHGGPWVLPVAALGFAISNHALFLLMHEAVHGIFHRRRWINECAGSLLAATFPQSFCLQRAFHLSHHRNNRTDREFFDGYHPHDSLFLKRWQWYGILLGEYWLRVPVACLLWLCCPWVLRAAVLRDRSSRAVTSFGGGDMLWSLDRVPPWRSRLEIICAIMVQILAWHVLGLTPLAWCACYGAFALNWGAHQYATHAWSVREIRDGAWNLRVHPLLGLLQLNTYDHLVHHRQPRLPWHHLPRFRDPAIPGPTFWRQYLSLWRGPRPAWGESPRPEEPQADDPEALLRPVSG
jgi:fatty acid desaturase